METSKTDYFKVCLFWILHVCFKQRNLKSTVSAVSQMDGFKTKAVLSF